MKSYINVCDVEKYYGSAAGMTKAVDRVSFQVSEGEFVGVMGASGSGKTTLLNMLATIDSVTAGHIYYQETDITELKPDQLAKFRKENLGFVFQEYNLLDTLTVGENIVLAMTLQNKSKKEIQKGSEEMMRLLGIWEIRNQFPYQVSGGQKQRCACARALINHPKLLLADEPTGALDSKAAETLLETFQSLNASKGDNFHGDARCLFGKLLQPHLISKRRQDFHELIRGQKGRREFLNAILDVLSATGGVKDAR